ncbi:hypothetical protein [Aureimonas phyllosphaerae]|uniref:Uncharacterized protein n=1 Tax=Aureimonas phyllosphaerae TaxID=1166078 RepID=A0A7W6C0J9_9HYPH|nr:hypothetical protein [Aureimonas phyllosphaerae]MBB3936192.1 hypothetical protein [Aureimonas phyllosphaerae]MBB3960083.1 hypothetical protein [Aureimonas phyllosphaerae]SFF33085.1 hypothetical protein SAMN05216566_10866 [Aureimonas phyllosphaerae]
MATGCLEPRILAERLDGWPEGHCEGSFEGRRFGVTLHRSGDGRRIWLYGEERGGGGIVSANLYRLADGEALLRPCEMPAEVVARFVLGFRPEIPS